MLETIYEQLGISKEVLAYAKHVEKSLELDFLETDRIAEFNQLKVLQAMQTNKISDMHFAGTTGYGYNDIGRDTLEDVYASVFHTEAALVRSQIISGTHALTVALSGNLRPGDEILAPCGKLYDTIQGVIGVYETKGSLKEYGIGYDQVELLEDKTFDFKGIAAHIKPNTRLVAIQKSRGYDTRPTFSNEQIKEVIDFFATINEQREKEGLKKIITMVDNCYGEFVEYDEPSDFGADMVVGSLIKNPGGSLAPIGGYIVGKKEYIENAAARLTAPGLNKEVGASLGVTRSILHGLFLAPTVVASAKKTAMFAAAVFEKLGFDCFPKAGVKRYDIIQAIDMGKEEYIVEFCKGIQHAAPVDSYVNPEPWDMPGYDAKVIMAAGTFIQGASIELSADAPIKEPYAVYFQGGITYPHGKFGILKALQYMVNIDPDLQLKVDATKK